MRDLGAPLRGPNTKLRGQRLVDCDTLADARALVKKVQEHWNTVVVRRRTAKRGVFAEVELYQKGRRYKA